MIFTTKYSSPIGELTLASKDNMLIGIWYAGQKYYMEGIKVSETTIKNNDPILTQTKKWLDDYFAGKNPKILDLPLCPEGSETQHLVWALVCNIPYGDTNSPQRLAKMLASLQEKGTVSEKDILSALDHNPISIIIPTHRVVEDGKKLDYIGGEKALDFLLKLEIPVWEEVNNDK